jgi:type IV secretion system protein VirD4
MRLRLLAVLCPLILLASLALTTQWVAHRLNHDPSLGTGLHLAGHTWYAPWSVFDWAQRFGQLPSCRRVFAIARLALVASALLSILPLIVARRAGGVRVKPLGDRKWGTERHMKAAGLLTGQGTVVGAYRARLLTYDGPEHQMVSGASRSGKGVGHVIPTLLNWPHSVLAYDVKGELWQLTAGFRSRFSHCLFFNPTRPDSARFNPLLEVRKGPDEVRDAQNIVEMLVNPDGSKLTLDIWDQQASQLLVALPAGTRLHTVLERLELPVAFHEPPRHLADQVRLGHVGAVGVAVERAVALDVLRQLVCRLDRVFLRGRDVERGQCDLGHGSFSFCHSATYGASTMSLFTSTRSGQPLRIVIVGCTSSSRSTKRWPTRDAS